MCELSPKEEEALTMPMRWEDLPRVDFESGSPEELAWEAAREVAAVLGER